jgi:hypothetical protein
MSGGASNGHELADLPPPSGTRLGATPYIPGSKGLTPRQQIHFYSPDEWEEFVLEYTTGLNEKYFQILRIGGSNDRGADVAAFLTSDGFEGDWDCLQCKHYEDALMPSDAFPEMLKLIRAVIEGHYSMPRRYLFMAPRGCGPTLKRLLNSPATLKTRFLEKFQGEKPLGAGLDPSLVAKILAEAEQLDFATFKSVEMHEILDVHRATAYHADRFSAPLPPRPTFMGAPEAFTEEETRYIEQLLAVYRERFGIVINTPSDTAAEPKISKHFGRQREAFYSAEALRVFARDSVLPGTFENLQDEVFEAVVETHHRDFNDGMERLTSVLEKAASVPITENRLIAVSGSRDKRGICHQLANADRLTWCDSP